MSRFNEREFEFCFNAEFVRKYTNALIGTPIIPSQRMESILGYDVEFRLRNGHFSLSLFLQHKVTSYAKYRSGRNAKFYDCYNGPYYRFPVERLDKTRQHNLLVELAEKGEYVFYCAPIFIGIDELQNYFVHNQVIDHARFFDPKEMGWITDFDQHHVTCDPTGSFGFFHSDPIKLSTVISWERLTQDLEYKKINLEYVETLQQKLSQCIMAVFEAKPSIPDKIKEKGAVMITSYILRRYFNLEWLII